MRDLSSPDIGAGAPNAIVGNFARPTREEIVGVDPVVWIEDGFDEQSDGVEIGHEMLSLTTIGVDQRGGPY